MPPETRPLMGRGAQDMAQPVCISLHPVHAGSHRVVTTEYGD